MGKFDGKWIYYHTAEKKKPDSRFGNPSPYFRKTFTLEGDIQSASLYVSAVGVFKAFVNGREVSDDCLSPGRCDYTKRLPLIEYDITELLSDKNAVGIVCGDGWALGSVPFGNSHRRNCFSDEIYLYAVIEILYKDGKRETVISDKAWKAGCGAVRYSGIHGGEFIDNRESCGDFSLYSYDDAAWSGASEDNHMFSKNHLLVPCSGPLMRVKGSLKPAKVMKVGEDTVYDFGKFINGIVEFVATGRSGDKITAEYSDDDKFSENSRDIFVLNGGDEEKFRPLFTMHKFRYIKISGKPKLTDVCAIEITSDIERTGDFYCSDTRINEQFVTNSRLLKRRLCSVPGGDTGFGGEISFDNSLFDMYNFNVKEFYEKYLEDIRDAQEGSGFIPGVIPYPRYGYRKQPFEDAVYMTDVLKIIYNHFVMYGDLQIIKDNIYMCKSAAAYLEQRFSDNLICMAQTYLYMVNICSAAGDRDAAEYSKKYDDVKLAYRSMYTGSHTALDEQKDYIEAFEAGVLTADEIRQPLINTVKREDEPHPRLLSVLCEIGEADTAYKLICEKPDMYTLHADFLFGSVLGIKPDSSLSGAGFKKVVIRPAIDLSEKICKAGGSCITPYGKISIYWEKTDDVYTCCLTVPFEIDATCRFGGFKVINQKCSRETYVFMLRKIQKQM